MMIKLAFLCSTVLTWTPDGKLPKALNKLKF